MQDVSKTQRGWTRWFTYGALGFLTLATAMVAGPWQAGGDPQGGNGGSIDFGAGYVADGGHGNGRPIGVEFALAGASDGADALRGARSFGVPLGSSYRGGDDGVGNPGGDGEIPLGIEYRAATGIGIPVGSTYQVAGGGGGGNGGGNGGGTALGSAYQVAGGGGGGGNGTALGAAYQVAGGGGNGSDPFGAQYRVDGGGHGGGNPLGGDYDLADSE